MKFWIDRKTLAKTVGNVSNWREMKLVARAHTSALRSCAWIVRHALRNHIEYGGDWKPLHPLTKEMRLTKAKKWAPRGWKDTPLFWLGRFARYVVWPGGEAAQIGFGKSNKGKFGSIDKSLDNIVRKHETGRTYLATEKMRRLWGASGKYALRRKTVMIRIPARPSIGPIFRKWRSLIPKRFKERFDLAMKRYLTGTNNKKKV